MRERKERGSDGEMNKEENKENKRYSVSKQTKRENRRAANEERNRERKLQSNLVFYEVHEVLSYLFTFISRFSSKDVNSRFIIFH